MFSQRKWRGREWRGNLCNCHYLTAKWMKTLCSLCHGTDHWIVMDRFKWAEGLQCQTERENRGVQAQPPQDKRQKRGSLKQKSKAGEWMWHKQKMFQMPALVVKIKMKRCSASSARASPIPKAHQSSVPGLSALSRPPRAQACGWGGDRDAEQAVEDSLVMTLLQPAVLTHRARISGSTFAISSRGHSDASSVLQRAGFYSTAFHKPWPRFSPTNRLCSAQDNGWQTKVAWSHLYTSPLQKQLGAGWSLSRLTSPQANTAPGYC